MIKATDIDIELGGTRIIDSLDLKIPDHKALALVGPNGSGKTTLLRALYGSVKPKKGEISLDGRPLKSFGRKELALELSVVTQEHQADLPLKVADLVMLGRLPHQGLTSRPSARDIAVAEKSLAAVGALHLAKRDFAGLSGGEKQRALIARALTQESSHILLDEPTNHLDIRYQHDVLSLVREKTDTSVMVLHDLNLATRYCDEIVVLSHGKIVAAGTPDEIMDPAILEPVYQLPIKRIDVDGVPTLIFNRATPKFLAGLGLEPEFAASQ
ncbi:ABC transporter ATP-binding protein [Corynebacterium caspium]|uniref:ABC transporter ATP-binding protein n=1 Tax=Corynebacterium caspium TaxID=234828 RepID=UPI00035D4696|nr:ABC transporter ATP-binding protein [Corynebacterium caspium]WKD58740.1 Iron(3+)-hydroxamate import ATP-binding protein FhuC [Corynebacterium caspium DSM 44850]